MIPADIRRYKQSSFPLLSAFIDNGQTGHNIHGSGFPSISGNGGNSGTRLPQISNRVSLVAMSQEERNASIIKDRGVAKYAMEARRERAPDRDDRNRGKRSRGTVDSDFRHKYGPVAERNAELGRPMAKYAMVTRRERAPDRNDRNRGKRSRGTVDSDLRHKPGPVGGQNSKPLSKQRNRHRQSQKTEQTSTNISELSEQTNLEKIKEIYGTEEVSQKQHHKTHGQDIPQMKSKVEKRRPSKSCDRNTTDETRQVTEAKKNLRQHREAKQTDNAECRDKGERNLTALSDENKIAAEPKKPSSGKRWKPIMVRRKKDTPALWSENAPADSWEEECKKANDLVRMNEAIKEAVTSANAIDKAKYTDKEISKNESGHVTVKEDSQVKADKKKSRVVKAAGHAKKTEFESNSKNDAIQHGVHTNTAKPTCSTNERKDTSKDSSDRKKKGDDEKVKNKGTDKANYRKRQVNQNLKPCVKDDLKGHNTEVTKENGVHAKQDRNKKKKKEHKNVEKHEELKHESKKKEDPLAKKRITSREESKSSNSSKDYVISNGQENDDTRQTGKLSKSKENPKAGTPRRVKVLDRTKDKGTVKPRTRMSAISDKTSATDVSTWDAHVSKQNPHRSVSVTGIPKRSVNKPSCQSQSSGQISRIKQGSRISIPKANSGTTSARQSATTQSHTSRSVSRMDRGHTPDTHSLSSRSVSSKTNENKERASRTSCTSAKSSLSKRSNTNKSYAKLGQKSESPRPCSVLSSRSSSRIPVASRSPSIRSATSSSVRPASVKSICSVSSARSTTKSLRKMTPKTGSVAKSSTSTSKASAISSTKSTRPLTKTDSRSSAKRKSAIPVPIRSVSKYNVSSTNNRFACVSRTSTTSTVSTMPSVKRSIDSRTSSIRTCISQASSRATSSALSSYSEEFEYESVASSTPESLSSFKIKNT